MEEREVTWSKKGPVALIEVNRPEKRNAISRAVLEGMHEAFDELDQDPDIKVVMTKGSGDVAWMAGFDLNYLRSAFLGNEDNHLCTRLYFKIRNSPKITIAVVNGYCLGGAISVLVAHDMAIASDRAKFGLPEIYRGGVARYALAAIFSAVPKTYAFEMTMTGLNWDAYKAERTGLVNQVVPHDQLLDKSYEFANYIAQWESTALSHNKRAGYRILDQLSYEQRVEINELSHEEHNLVSKGQGFQKGVDDMLAGKGTKANA